MAITIDWGTKIIYVPKADLTLIQSTPTEIRELNLNWFRMQLKDLEDGEEGMAFLDTHRHNTEVMVGGITLARVIEIINGYTVTFEDGQYAVNLVGANSNVGDVVNVNQVSVRSYNSAGLISSPDIEYASFQNCVTIDVTSPWSGTLFPIGTKRQPVNNLVDAMLISVYRGFTAFFVIGDLTVDASGDYSGMTFIGSGMSKSTVDVEASANVLGCEFIDCHLTGVLDGKSTAKNCRINDLNYINGVIQECLLEEGEITLGGSDRAVFLDCWSGGSEEEAPVINCGGSGQELVVRNYSGSLRLRNKTGSDAVAITLSAGRIHLENTVEAGVILVSGVGACENEGTATVDTSELLNQHSIADEIFLARDVETGLNFLESMKLILASAAGKLSGAQPGSTTITIKNALVGNKNRIVATVDEYGNRYNLVFDLTD